MWLGFVILLLSRAETAPCANLDYRITAVQQVVGTHKLQVKGEIYNRGTGALAIVPDALPGDWIVTPVTKKRKTTGFGGNVESSKFVCGDNVDENGIVSGRCYQLDAKTISIPAGGTHRFESSIEMPRGVLPIKYQVTFTYQYSPNTADVKNGVFSCPLHSSESQFQITHPVRH
jgi:hypothetical protein